MANELTAISAPDFGVLSGRIQPADWRGLDGSWAICLGADRTDFVVDAWPGFRTGVNGIYPTLFSGGETLQVAVDGGATQTVTFAATDQTVEDVVTAVNAQTTDLTASDDGGELRIESDTLGYRSSIQIVGGTGIAQFGHLATTGVGHGGVDPDDYVGFVTAGTVDFTSVTLLTFAMQFIQPTNTGITFRLVVLVGGVEVYETIPDQGETIDAATRYVNVAAITGSQTLEFRLEAMPA